MQFAEETAIVSSVDGDYVFLETQNSASCGNCSSKSGCGNVSSIFTLKTRNKLKINNTLKLKEGDSVIVALATDKLLKATVIMYLLPILSMFAFSLLAKLFLGETASILMGLTGLFLGILWVKKFTQQSETAQQFQPKLVRKVINVETV